MDDGLPDIASAVLRPRFAALLDSCKKTPSSPEELAAAWSKTFFPVSTLTISNWMKACGLSFKTTVIVHGISLTPAATHEILEPVKQKRPVDWIEDMVGALSPDTALDGQESPFPEQPPPRSATPIVEDPHTIGIPDRI